MANILRGINQLHLAKITGSESGIALQEMAEQNVRALRTAVSDSGTAVISDAGVYPITSAQIDFSNLSKLLVAPGVLFSVNGVLVYPGLLNKVIQTLDDTRQFQSRGTKVFDWTDGTLTLASANGGGEAAELDTTVLVDGKATLKCTLSSGTYLANLALTANIRVANLDAIQIPIKFTSNSGFVAGTNPFQLWFYDSTLVKTWRIQIDTSTLRPDVWNLVSVRSGAATEGWVFSGGPTASSDLDDETVARVRVVLAVPAGASGTKIWVGPVRMNQRRKGCVSIVMDGEYDSQYQYALPILDKYGIPASLALVHGNVGKSTYMTYAQLDEAYANGHECLHHTTDAAKTGGYSNSSQWPTQSDIQTDISRGILSMSNQGYLRGMQYAVHAYTYPWDQTITKARQDIVTAAYLGAGIKGIRKSIGVSTRLQSLAQPAVTDPYLLQGAIQISGHVSSDVTPYVDAAESLGEWAILTFHKFVLNSAVPGSLEMEHGEFDTLMAYIWSKWASGKIDVMLMSKTCETYGLTSV